MDFIQTTFREIKKNFKKVLYITVITMGISFLASTVLIRPKYETSTELIANYERSGEETGMDAINASKNLAALYQDMIDNRLNYKAVRDQIQPEASITEISDSFEVTVKDKTPIVLIKAVSKDEELSKEFVQSLLSTPLLTELIENKDLEYVRAESPYDTKMISNSTLFTSVLFGLLAFMISWIYIFIRNSLSSSVIAAKQIEDLTGEKVDLTLSLSNDRSALNFAELLIQDYLENNTRTFLFNTFSDTELLKESQSLLTDFGYHVGYFKIYGEDGQWILKNMSNDEQVQEVASHDLLEFSFANLDYSKPYEIVLIESSVKDPSYSYVLSKKPDHNYLLVSQNKTKEKDLMEYLEKASVFELDVDRICLIDYEEENDIY